MEGSVEENGAPDSWEMADLDESMSRLLVSCKKNPSSSQSPQFVDDAAADGGGGGGDSSVGWSGDGGGMSTDGVNQVDQFLREALQNPRERLSVLRLEQDVEKFIRDPVQQQLEFPQLPTSYLRLAAHRVAQHYNLLSMVILDNNVPDGSASKIVVRKTSSDCRFPSIRLADIPLNLPQEDGKSVAKVAIKQRPQKRSSAINSANQHSSKANLAKSVEERKEEYNRARARIFSSSSGAIGSNSVSVKSESESTIQPIQDSFQQSSLGSIRVDEQSAVEGPDLGLVRGLADSSAGLNRSSRGRIEKETVGRYRPNSRVAIFRDREVDRKDPDYDRSYDKYMQRFDPGFGFNGGPYTVQPMYSPAINYNTEFPQLGAVHRPQLSIEHQPRPVPQHLGPWATTPNHAGMGYGPPEAMMSPVTPNHVGAPSASGAYLHSSNYAYPRPGMPFINPHEQVHLPFAQPHQQQREANFRLARPR